MSPEYGKQIEIRCWLNEYEDCHGQGNGCGIGL